MLRLHCKDMTLLMPFMVFTPSEHDPELVARAHMRLLVANASAGKSED